MVVVKNILLVFFGIIDIQVLEDIAISAKIIGQSLNFTIIFQRMCFNRFTSLGQFLRLSYFPFNPFFRHSFMTCERLTWLEVSRICFPWISRSFFKMSSSNIMVILLDLGWWLLTIFTKHPLFLMVFTCTSGVSDLFWYAVTLPTTSILCHE